MRAAVFNKQRFQISQRPNRPDKELAARHSVPLGFTSGNISHRDYLPTNHLGLSLQPFAERSRHTGRSVRRRFNYEMRLFVRAAACVWTQTADGCLDLEERSCCWKNPEQVWGLNSGSHATFLKTHKDLWPFEDLWWIKRLFFLAKNLYFAGGN